MHHLIAFHQVLLQLHYLFFLVREVFLCLRDLFLCSDLVFADLVLLAPELLLEVLCVLPHLTDVLLEVFNLALTQTDLLGHELLLLLLLPECRQLLAKLVHLALVLQLNRLDLLGVSRFLKSRLLFIVHVAQIRLRLLD